MPAAAELQGPVAYADVWAQLAIGGLVAVAVYYAAALWWTRDRVPRRDADPPGRRTRHLRRRHLRELDAVERRVREGQISARRGHQEISTIVRDFAEAMGVRPASAMTLNALRPVAPRPLTDLVASLYEPAFAGDEPEAAERFARAVDRARQVVTSWS